MSLQLTFVGPTESHMIPVEWLEIQTYTGNMVILEGHAPARILIKPESTARWQQSSGTIESMTVQRGFLEVHRDRAFLIL